MRHFDVKSSLLAPYTMHVCDKCAMRYACRHEHPDRFRNIVQDIKAFRKKGVVDEEIYHELIRLAISIYVQGEIEKRVSCKVDEALSEKLSPAKLLEAMVA